MQWRQRNEFRKILQHCGIHLNRRPKAGAPMRHAVAHGRNRTLSQNFPYRCYDGACCHCMVEPGRVPGLLLEQRSVGVFQLQSGGDADGLDLPT